MKTKKFLLLLEQNKLYKQSKWKKNLKREPLILLAKNYKKKKD